MNAAPLTPGQVVATWLGSLFAAILLLALGAWLDGPTDAEAAQDTADALAQAVELDQLQQRMDAAAVRLCQAVGGPRAAPVERPGGELGCNVSGAL